MYDNIQLNGDEVRGRKPPPLPVPYARLTCSRAVSQPFPLQAGVDNFITNLVKKVSTTPAAARPAAVTMVPCRCRAVPDRGSGHPALRALGCQGEL